MYDSAGLTQQALHDLCLQQQVVRDMAWAVFGPNLIDDYHFHSQGQGIRSCHIPLTSQRIEWLQALDRDSSDLTAALSQRKSTRLGVYFEFLWQFFLQQDTELSLLAANLPVYRDKTTLGEFDLIYRDDSRGDIIHLELATKYYLNTLATPTDPSGQRPLFANWLGPNTKDRLDKKLQRLLTHQTRLNQLPEGERLLAEKNWQPAIPHIALKGFLFEQLTAPAARPLVSPLNPTRCSGQWLPISQLSAQLHLYERWLILQRPQWISPAQLDDGDLSRTATAQTLLLQLNTVFNQQDARPVMLCGLRKNWAIWQEAARFMVTHEEWPLPKIL